MRSAALIGSGSTARLLRCFSQSVTDFARVPPTRRPPHRLRTHPARAPQKPERGGFQKAAPQRPPLAREAHPSKGKTQAPGRPQHIRHLRDHAACYSRWACVPAHRRHWRGPRWRPHERAHCCRLVHPATDRQDCSVGKRPGDELRYDGRWVPHERDRVARCSFGAPRAPGTRRPASPGAGVGLRAPIARALPTSSLPSFVRSVPKAPQAVAGSGVPAIRLPAVAHKRRRRRRARREHPAPCHHHAHPGDARRSAVEDEIASGDGPRPRECRGRPEWPVLRVRVVRPREHPPKDRERLHQEGVRGPQAPRIPPAHPSQAHGSSRLHPAEAI
ncbi:uncharacterized protein CMC5_048940 [Chondromyces crocatus]|uniref:Uncharacterized protein n=1 Tax=Chondromyces crocatus TaxID=52 RepID=A0A0K1EJH8_CHOCO|nr:uncharacterized protein CMC5_048940 [Chondromyces crocatus]